MKKKIRKQELPVGTEVQVLKDNGDVVATKTRSLPWKLGGHTWVVMLEGISGCYDLARVSVRAEAAR